MREVTLDANGPVRLDDDDIDDEKGDIAVCRCGLSDGFPFCDGSHRATEDETEGVRYKYVDGERRVVEEIRLAAEDEDDRELEGENADPEANEDGADPTDPSESGSA